MFRIGCLDYEWLSNIHFDTMKSFLENLPRHPGREDFSDRDDPYRNALPTYPWSSTSFLPRRSQDGRTRLNFPLPRSHTTTLCRTMKMYSKSPLTIA